MDNTEQLYNLPTPSVNLPIPLAANQVSESVQLATMAANSTYDTGLEPLSESLKRLSTMLVPSFGELYTPTITGGGISSGGISTSGGGLSLFNRNTTEAPSWEGEKIDMDQYFTRMGEDWANIDKENAALIGVGGGILAGAGTGAAVGSLGGPIGAAIGAVVGGILGGIEGNQVSKNIGYGYVRNKYGVNEETEYNKQGFWGRAGSGVMNMVHAADSLTLGTLGTIAYLPKAISEQSMNTLFNNDFTKLLDGYDKSSQNSNQIYHSNAYDSSSLVGKLAHSELWFEQVAPAVGFMVGAIGIGKATGLGLGAVGLNTTAGATAGASRALLSSTISAAARGEVQALGRQTLLKGFKEAVKQDLRNQTFRSVGTNLVTMATSAAPESGLEARGAMNEARENYVESFSSAYGRLPTPEELIEFDNSNKSAGNGVFASNLAVVGMSNWMQFGDLIGVDKVLKKGFLDDAINRTFGLGIRQTVGDVSEKGLRSAVWNAVERTKFQKVGYRTFKALEKPVTEGVWEEGIQHVISGTHKDYLESRFNPQATEINKSLISAFGHSFLDTYTSTEGWNDIMIGMIVGAGGSARFKGGADFLGQREVSRQVAGINQNVAELNKTQKDFIDAQEDFLSKQAIYNNLSNDSTNRLGDKIGGLNQQIINSDLSKKHLAEGNLEQAQTAYQNAVFAKMSAEKRAGLSESNQFDIDTMVDTIPDETLQQLYNFRTPEQISEFKDETKLNLTNTREAFDASYALAETLNIGSGSRDFSPAQVTEMAALNFFHGMQSADNANNLAQGIEKTIGISGVADSLNYYSNLSKIQQTRVNDLDSLQEQLKELETQHNELLNNFSTQVVKPIREVENTAIVTQLDQTNNKLEAVASEMESINNRISSLTDILNSQESIPALPFGNAASKFFDGINLSVADSEVSQVLTNLKSLDKYIEHLLNSTEKSAEDIASDRNKAEVLQGLIEAYKSQMGLMRNFAKVAQMVVKPAYMNNLSKGIFSSKKYNTIFDNNDWVDNNQSGLDELSKEDFKRLKEKIDSGQISKYDIHTHLTNFEIMRMGLNTQENKTINESTEDVLPMSRIQEFVNDTEDGMALDTQSDVYNEVFNEIAEIVSEGGVLSPNQKNIFDAIQSNESERERFNELVNDLKSEAEVSPVSMGTPERNTQLAQEQRLNKLAEERRKEINERYDSLVDDVAGTISNTENIDDTITLEEGIKTIEDQISELNKERNSELEDVDSQLEEAKTPIEIKNIQIHTELGRLNTFIENLLVELKRASKEYNTETIDEFDLKPSTVAKNFEEYKTLAQKGVRNEKDQLRFEELKNIINRYGLVEGRLGDFNDTPIRLSDILEQRVALENELFNPSDEFNPLLDSEMALVTTDSPTEEFVAKTKGGDPSVLNNYDFATFSSSNSSADVSIANISPEFVIFQVLEGKDASTVTVDNVEAELTETGYNIQPGQTVEITFANEEGGPQSISFQLDKSRRILLPQEFIPVLEENSGFVFDSKNIIGSSGYYTLTMDVGGTQVPVKSDFDIAALIDSDSAQKLNPGDAITFEIELDATYNKDLMDRLSPFISSVSSEDNAKLEPLLNLANEAVSNKNRMNVIKANIQSTQQYIDTLGKLIDEANEAEVEDLALHNKNVVYPLIDKVDAEHKKIDALEKESKNLLNRNKEIRIALNVDYSKVPFDRISSNIEKKLAKSKLSDAQQKEFDAVRKEFKDGMVIVAKNSGGKTVGVVKSQGNSNGQNALYMDYLRGSLFSSFENNNYQRVKSNFTVPVQVVYMGIPNISSIGEGKVMYEFSREKTDNSINPSKITDIGYVSFGELKFNSGVKVTTPYNYAQSIMRDKAYMGRRVPVVTFNHNGKAVIYPISLRQTLNSEDVVADFNTLVENKSMDLSSYLTRLNEFLSSNGISPNYRLSSLNYSNEYIEEVREAILNSEFYPSVENFVNSKNISQTLIENATIDIDLNNNPFIGPKIRLGLEQVPEFNSELSAVDKVISDDSSVKTQIDENIEDNNCNFEID